ncbi:MAG: hypothetical protein ABJD11_14825 [Gemmatimonadota bacterium]
MTRPRPALLALAAVFMFTGMVHLLAPQVYLGIMPPWAPHPLMLVYISGVCELLGGIGILLEPVRRTAGIGLILLLVAVFPANVQMLSNHLARGTTALEATLLWLRLPLQAVLVWWVWSVTRPVTRGIERPGETRAR